MYVHVYMYICICICILLRPQLPKTGVLDVPKHTQCDVLLKYTLYNNKKKNKTIINK